MSRRKRISESMFMLAPRYAKVWLRLTCKERHILMVRRMQAVPGTLAELADHYATSQQHIAVVERNTIEAVRAAELQESFEEQQQKRIPSQ